MITYLLITGIILAVLLGTVGWTSQIVSDRWYKRGYRQARYDHEYGGGFDEYLCYENGKMWNEKRDVSP